MGYRIEPKSVMARAARTKWQPLQNRRREARTQIPSGPFGARLMGGIDVTLCNLSRRGMLFESPLRLLVGSPALLRVRTGEVWVELKGRVVRCCVSATLRGRLRYETALELEADCPIDELTGLLGMTSEGELTLLDSELPILTDPSMN